MWWPETRDLPQTFLQWQHYCKRWGQHWACSNRGVQHGKVRCTGEAGVWTTQFWAGPYFVAFPNLRDALLNHVPIETRARSCTILPSFVGWVGIGHVAGGAHWLEIRIRFMVYNGKEYLPVTVTQDMVGHKLGEFSHTRKRFIYR